MANSNNKQNKKKRIVIAGAGFAGVYTYRYLHPFLHRHPEVETHIINKTNYFLFTPLLHEVATGGVVPHHTIEPLRAILPCCVADFHFTSVEQLSLSAKEIITAHGPVPYDYLVLSLGSTTHYYGIPGATERTFSLKTLNEALRLKKHIVNSFERATKEKNPDRQRELLTFVVVGGGATGVEIAAELQEFVHETLNALYAHNQFADKIRIMLIHKLPELLPQFPTSLRRIASATLAGKHISVLCNTGVAAVQEDKITLENGNSIPTRTVIWAAGIIPTPLSTDVPLPKDETGRIITTPELSLPDYPSVYVVGDMGNGGGKRPVPALAQAAVQEAKTAAHNIACAIQKKPLRPFVFRPKGDLLSLGRWNAAGVVRGVTISGKFAWWLWRTVYLFKLISWRKKINVAVDWTLNIFSRRDISEI